MTELAYLTSAEAGGFQPYFDKLAITREQLAQRDRLKLLNTLNTAHIAELPFSSVSVLLGRPLPLDIVQLIDKMVINENGGYCFEHNKLFHYVLQSLGFKLRSVWARVLYNKDVDAPTSPKTHRLILLEHEGASYVVDVGFGANGPKCPVKLSVTPTHGPGEDQYRIAKNVKGDYLFQVLKNDAFFTLYSFDLHYYNEADFDMGHFYSHKHPEAGFVNNLVVARLLEGEVRSLRNNCYKTIYPDRTVDEVITTHLQLQTIFSRQFNHNESEEDCEFLFNNFCLEEKE